MEIIRGNTVLQIISKSSEKNDLKYYSDLGAISKIIHIKHLSNYIKYFNLGTRISGGSKSPGKFSTRQGQKARFPLRQPNTADFSNRLTGSTCSSCFRCLGCRCRFGCWFGCSPRRRFDVWRCRTHWQFLRPKSQRNRFRMSAKSSPGRSAGQHLPQFQLRHLVHQLRLHRFLGCSGSGCCRCRRCRFHIY